MDGASDRLPRDDGSRPAEGAVAPATAGTGRHGPMYYVTLVAGWGVIAFGLHGLLTTRGTNPPAVLTLLVELNVVNDAIVLPAVVVVGLLLSRVVPRWCRAPLQVGLITTAVVTLYSYPLVAGYGRGPRAGFSRLPWNYAHNLAIVLAVVWAVTGLLAMVSWRRARSNGR